LKETWLEYSLDGPLNNVFLCRSAIIHFSERDFFLKEFIKKKTHQEEMNNKLYIYYLYRKTLVDPFGALLSVMD
jgi:hypothetical protein